jgi:hypothetical protein
MKIKNVFSEKPIVGFAHERIFEPFLAIEIDGQKDVLRLRQFVQMKFGTSVQYFDSIKLFFYMKLPHRTESTNARYSIVWIELC